MLANALLMPTNETKCYQFFYTPASFFSFLLSFATKYGSDYADIVKNGIKQKLDLGAIKQKLDWNFST